FLYFSRSVDAGKTGIYLGSLGSKEIRLLISAESNVTYVPPGFLIYGRGEALLSQPFDVKRLELTGEPFPIANQVERIPPFGGSAFSVADSGVLMYRSPSSYTVQLAWYGRDGKRLQSVGEPGEYPQILLSPDEKRLAVERSGARNGEGNIWMLELSTG